MEDSNASFSWATNLTTPNWYIVLGTNQSLFEKLPTGSVDSTVNGNDYRLKHTQINASTYRIEIFLLPFLYHIIAGCFNFVHTTLWKTMEYIDWKVKRKKIVLSATVVEENQMNNWLGFNTFLEFRSGAIMQTKMLIAINFASCFKFQFQLMFFS